MNKNKIFGMLLSLAAAMGMVACSDDTTLPELRQPTVATTRTTYNTLAFEWDKVAGAVQYGYQLVDNEQMVADAGVTTSTKVVISNLKDNTEYTLKVWPFAGLNVDYSAPAPVEITAKTEAIIKLDTPVVTIENNETTAVFSWTRVANAESYSYVLYKDGEQFRKGNVTALKLTLRNLEPAVYVFTLQATTTEGGYSSSDMVSESFTIEDEEGDKTWSVTGEYYNDYLYDSYTATLVYNEDGTYTIPAFHGNEGFDLTFKVSDNGDVEILSGSRDEAYQYVAVGPDEYIYIYLLGGGFGPEFDGDKEGGEFWFGYYDGDWDDYWYEDSFTWGTTTRGKSVKHNNKGPRHK